MTDWTPMLLALALSLALVLLAAGVVGRRGGHGPRRARLVLGSGAALGGLALLLLSLSQSS
jgi:hypothetical protein